MAVVTIGEKEAYLPLTERETAIAAVLAERLIPFTIVYYNKNLECWTATLKVRGKEIKEVYQHASDEQQCKEEFKEVLLEWVEACLMCDGFASLLQLLQSEPESTT